MIKTDTGFHLLRRTVENFSSNFDGYAVSSQEYVFGSDAAYGAAQRASREAAPTIQDLKALISQIPVANDVSGVASRYISGVASEFAASRPRFGCRVPAAHRRIQGDDEHAYSHSLTRRMNNVSAMEAAKGLLSGMETLGSTEERLAVAVDMFDHGIATSVAPSSPAYQRLLQLLGPLQYSPRIEAHPEAATIRRAAMNHAVNSLQGAIVGLVAPSKAEIHAFPNAAIWEYEHETDVTRHRKHCSLCKLPRCQLLLAAKKAGRVYVGNDWSRAAGVFARFDVGSLVLINIEPNLSANNLTAFMVKAKAYHAYSLVTVDWRALMGRPVTDTLVNMTTEVSYGKLVSSFGDGGDYVQSLAAAKQVFAPTYSHGHALRRTVIFGDGASQYFDLSLVKGGWATRCLPDHAKYYFIRVMLPDLSRPVVIVEKKGFDRVLATYRTQAIKDRGIARIVLRQSVVTYSISGTQVTPRIALSATEAEALGIWIEIYSEVQDRLGEAHANELRNRNTAHTVKSAIFGKVAKTIATTPAGAMAVASLSTLEAMMNLYRSDVGEMTLDQLSQATMEEHFGTKIAPDSLFNMVASAWGNLHGWVTNPNKWYKTIERVFNDAWCVSFGYFDLVAVVCLLTGNFSIQTARVVLDCLDVAARVMGKIDALRPIRRLIDHMDWMSAKMNKMWVVTQDAQSLDFQAAMIDIIETFFNLFGTDHAADIQKIREKQMLSEEAANELELNAGLPFSDFLSEIKLFLGRFNSNVTRAALCASMLSAFHHDARHCSAEQKAKMVHLFKEEMKNVPLETQRRVLGFALTGQCDVKPIPIRPINGQGVRESFEKKILKLDQAEGEVSLHRLEKINGVFDFSPIHALMDLQHGDTVNPANAAGPNYISPDSRGAHIQEQLVAYAADHLVPARFVPVAAMGSWYAAQKQSENIIPYVRDVLEASSKLFTGQEQRSKWIAHVTGLAMGGKSKGLREWISVNDLVVVPTAKLKAEWQEALGKEDPARRATVVTQHEALVTKYASRYVFIDECYAFDPEHLQAIANRHWRSKGVITIGDRRQISNVFTTTGLQMIVKECPCVMITPTTFVGWDAACVYLNGTTTDVHVEHLFCGNDSCETLVYALSSDDTLMPGDGDQAIQGTQIGKEMARMRGLDAITVHEAQGSRSEHTIIHGVGRALTGDLKWLGDTEQHAHMGVAITRARVSTIFVVEGIEAFSCFRWYDEATVNGALPATVLLGGTSWDLVEPRTESESVWEHLHQEKIPQSYLLEVPLTDKISIGTVFAADGEPISTSEVRTNVELVAGVSLRDDNIPLSDDFDNYTSQPRDHPGADMVQAMTRAVKDARATPQDFVDAERIVELIFEEVIDKPTFFSHLANSQRAALKRQTRQQVIDGCYAGTETASSVLSFAFLKPEFAKKPSELRDGPSELKAQGVVSASDMQQAIFADCCDSLTHAWARAMKKGKLSPVGLRESEVEDFLATYESSYELDIEKQDSSHKPVHVLVASIFLQMASEKLGLGQLAREIREERRVRMMGAPFKFLLNTALASGDPWTLIINKIMAVSSLISVARLSDVRMCQSGDDVTLDKEPEWRDGGLHSQFMANKGLSWKKEEREKRKEGVTFISRAVLPHGTVVYKALRTILKYAYRKRNSIQHAGIKADALRVQRLAAASGLQAYAEARCQVWGGDPVVVFDMWTRALAVARSDFRTLPPELRSEEPRQYSIRERDGGCFGYALAQCVEHNVQAINAIASYRRPVTITEAIKACRENGVRYICMNEPFARRSRKRLQDEMDRKSFTNSFVVIYEDHAVAVVPNTITIHSGFGKRQISWKSSTSKEVEITEFE